MKKLLLSAVLFSTMTFGQKFTLTPENFKNEDGKEFYIVEMQGKTQSDLFKSVKMYVTSNYKNLKGDGYNEVEPNQIVLNFEQSAGTVKRLGIPVIGGDFTNRYELNFKDGKIMIKPQFTSIELPDGMGGLTDKDAYNKKGKMNINEIYFNGIQEKTNEFVKNLVEGIKKEDNW